MDTIIRIKNVLRDGLSLGARADSLTTDSRLLGSVPELDSMAVVQIITMLESEFGITIDDDEMSAEVFATVGSLARFVTEKTAV
jgi:acyl carrier protein